MPRRYKQNKEQTFNKTAMSPESRENQMIDLAVKQAESQLRAGTAPPTVVNHYLKLATQREGMSRLKMEKEVELMTAKTENLKSAKNAEEQYTRAIEAMKNYAPSNDS